MLATAYFLQLFPKLEALSLKMLVELKSSRPEEKLLIKSGESMIQERSIYTKRLLIEV